MIDCVVVKKVFIFVFSLSLFIFSFLFRFLDNKAEIKKNNEATSVTHQDKISPTILPDILQKGDKIACEFDKNKDGNIELKAGNQSEENDPNCILTGCNIYEFE